MQLFIDIQMATYCRHPTHNSVEEHLASSSVVEIWLSVIRQQYFTLTSRKCPPARDGALWRYNYFKKMEGAFLCAQVQMWPPATHTGASSRKRRGDEESTIFFILIKRVNDPPSCWFTEEHGCIRNIPQRHDVHQSAVTSGSPQRKLSWLLTVDEHHSSPQL